MVSRHDVGLASENAGGLVLEVQIKQAERANWMINTFPQSARRSGFNCNKLLPCNQSRRGPSMTRSQGDSGLRCLVFDALVTIEVERPYVSLGAGGLHRWTSLAGFSPYFAFRI